LENSTSHLANIYIQELLYCDLGRISQCPDLALKWLSKLRIAGLELAVNIWANDHCSQDYILGTMAKNPKLKLFYQESKKRQFY